MANEMKVASIHVYGTSKFGFGALVALAAGTTFSTPGATSETVVREGRSATQAVFLAIDGLRERNVRRGPVTVHYDFEWCSKFAQVRLEGRIPYWGELVWHDDDGVVISAEAIEKASEKV